MKPEEIEKAKYDAFIEAMRRFRWSVLATTLVASTILAHILIEHVDHGPITNTHTRIMHHVPETATVCLPRAP